MFSVFLQGEYNEKNCLRQARRRAFRGVCGVSGAGSGGAWRRFRREWCRFSWCLAQVQLRTVQVQPVLGAGSAANGAGSAVNGAGSRTGGAGSGCQRCRFTDRRRKFRVSTVQVPKHARNLRRISAFYALLLVQVSALKWNLRHLQQDLQQFCTASYTFFLMEQKNVNYLNRKYFDAAMAFSGLIHLGECAEIQNHFAF